MKTSRPTSNKNPCFCDPWNHNELDVSDVYTDTDLASELNALTFAERQAMEEDIHGVADAIEETPEFVTAKIEEMLQAVAELNPQRRQAWDRAVFLRPALMEDRRLHLMFLRARRFRVNKAVELLCAYFRAKRDLFGDELLIHRITWNDLTEQEWAFFRCGAYRLIPNSDRSGRSVFLSMMSRFDSSQNSRTVARSVWYIHLAVEDRPTMQQKGMVTVVDFSGQWSVSPFDIMRHMATYPHDAVPIHDVCMHVLNNDSSMHNVIPKLRNLLRKENRMKVRFHRGSSLEMEYALRAFGIDVSRQLFQAQDKMLDSHYDDSLEGYIKERQRIEDEWRQSEATYRHPSSPVALFPNPQDIIMGRNKAVALTWPGNVMFHKVIQQHVGRYIEAQGTPGQIGKTMITVEVRHLFQTKYKSRFLVRNNTSWVVIDDSESHAKISQALRNAARDIGSEKGWAQLKLR